MRAPLSRRAFHRALEILGGKEQLASFLGVDSECLEKWSAGAEEPPLKVLQSVAELIKHELLKKYRSPSSKKLSRAKKRARR